MKQTRRLHKKERLFCEKVNQGRATTSFCEIVLHIKYDRQILSGNVYFRLVICALDSTMTFDPKEADKKWENVVDHRAVYRRSISFSPFSTNTINNLDNRTKN
jgi:hypothetical protein